MSLTAFRTLGRSGLIVSPLCLGTMTFGTPRWGSPDDVSESVFNAYVDAGGNFIDTADVYSKGRSEELVGAYIANRKLRDKLVLATKFTFNAEPGNPNAGGNGRKNVYRALEGSLRRLGTDYIDFYWMHAWDMVTPVEEMLQTFGDLVRAGKIRYFGFSNMPAWYAAKASALAASHSVPGPIAMQLAYSLVERSIEREYIPMARDCGFGVTPWSPLAFGFLTGKYSRGEDGKPKEGNGRLDLNLPSFQSFAERNWRVLEVLRTVAAETGRSLAQTALAWVSAQPGVTSPIIGANTIEQLQDNIASLDLKLTADQLKLLSDASALDPVYPYPIFTPQTNRAIFGGAAVQGWS